MTDKEVVEQMIGKQVTETIITCVRRGFTAEEILHVYAVTIGAVMSVSWKDGTASGVKNVIGEWAKTGFLDANALDVEDR